MKIWFAIVAVLAMGGAAFGAPYTGPNQPTAQGPYYPVTGAQLYYWNHTLGYSVPADDVTGFPVNCISGCSGGSGGGGTVTQGPAAAASAPWYIAPGTGAVFAVSQSGTWTEVNSAAILAAENSTLASPGSSSASATGVQGVTGGKPVAVSDPANAAFSTSTAITVAGATVAAGRTLQVDCSVGGAITMTLSGGGSAVLNVLASAQSQFFPFAVTAITASTATGTYHNLN